MNGQRLFGALTAGVALAVLAVAARPAQAQGNFQVDSFFDVFVDITTSDPGDPPIEVGVFNTQPGGETIPTEIVSMDLVGPPNVPVRMQARGGGGGGGGNFAVDSFFDVFYDVTDPYLPVDSFFDVFVDIEDVTGSVQAPVMLSAPQVNDWAVDSFFDITYQFDLGNGGRQTLNFRGTPAPGMKLSNVQVTTAEGDSFFDVFTELTTTVEPPPPSPGPAMTMRMTGVYTPEPSSIVLAMLGLVGFVGYARRRRRAVGG